jgi:hypothetical protein
VISIFGHLSDQLRVKIDSICPVIETRTCTGEAQILNSLDMALLSGVQYRAPKTIEESDLASFTSLQLFHSTKLSPQHQITHSYILSDAMNDVALEMCFTRGR